MNTRRPFPATAALVALGLCGVLYAAADAPTVLAAESPNDKVVTPPKAADDAALLASLKPDSRVAGFRAEAVYLNESDKPFGARFVHEKTGFTLDVLRIQTAPQSFLWVNSPPTSDKGEPHTQEHLLLGKGNRGRAAASLEDLSLAGSSAFTQQWRTCYHLFTEAGGDVFLRLMDSQIDALLHPDYSDEEIRREVRNWDVTPNQDGTLRLEEKGTVYNEMVSSTDKPSRRVWDAMKRAVYGENHPLSANSGGSPEALRTLTPEDIRAFHARTHHLNNMGAVVAWPREMPLEATLSRVGAILTKNEPTPPMPGRAPGATTAPAFPAPRPAPAGSVFSVPYPDSNAQQPGDVYFVWPAERKLTARDESLLGLFLDAFAGDADTDLYKRFVDSKTRARDTGAQGVFGWVDSDAGHPVYVGLTGVPAGKRTEADMKQAREEVRNALRRIAALPDGSPELLAFNRRVLDRLTASRRSLSKFVNSPPGFGFRGSGSAWMEQLLLLERAGGFRRSVTLRPEMEGIAADLKNKRNLWREKLAAWRLLEAVPYAATALPDPNLAARQDADRRARADAEAARLAAAYGVTDKQEAIRRYKTEYDAKTATLEAAAQSAPPLRFLENPPLTADERLDYKVTRIGGEDGVPQVASTFKDMTGATASLALRLDGAVKPGSRFLVGMLPALLSRAGVIGDDGKPLSYEQVSERQRREILSAGAGFSTNEATRRVELSVSGSGNDPYEAKNAVAWMRRYLLAPDWRPENLPRLRDLVDQSLAGLRNRMKGSEESWVNAVSGAYYRQDDPLLLSVNSFLTRAHDTHRLRWRLMDGTPAEREEAATFLRWFAALPAEAGNQQIDVALKSSQILLSLKSDETTTYDGDKRLSPGARKIALEAARDLELTLPDLPRATLAADWAYLCRQMAADLTVGPEKTLAELHELRRALLKTGAARLTVTGSPKAQQEIARPLADLVAKLDKAPAPAPRTPSEPSVLARLRARTPGLTEKPTYVGLLAPDMPGGVFLHSAPGTSLRDTDQDSVLRYLAAKLYGGSSPDGVFMKTWGAGLAYSNGLGAGATTGRITYYAERTPELPQTLKFVIGLLKDPAKNPRLAEYAVAGAFAGGRAASAYESRGAAMADDLADGYTPETVSAFRRAVLTARARPDLTDALYARLPGEIGKVLPGYGPKASAVPDAVYFVIGPEKQFAAYEAYLKEVEGPGATLYRLYPRDFWLPMPE